MTPFIWGLIVGLILGIFATSFIAVTVICLPERRRQKDDGIPPKYLDRGTPLSKESPV